MAKGAVGLTAGYWPEDIYRYLAVPSLSLDDGILARPGKRRPDHVALVQGDEAFSYRQLSQDIERASGLVRAAVAADGNRVALAVRSAPDLFRLLLGALKARCTVLLLDLDAGAERLELALSSFGPDLVLADAASTPALPAGSSGRRVVDLDAFWKGEPARGSATGRTDLKGPTVGLVRSGGQIAYHAHASLIAWAVSWSAFVPLTETSVVLSLEPLYRWGGLLSVAGALFRGGTCVFTSPGPGSSLAAVVEQHRPGFLVVSLATAERLAATRDVQLRQILRQHVEGIFVTIDNPFSIRDRRRIEATLGVPILTLAGNAAAGPVMASHPTWYLDEAAGIPVTNVDLWPLNPITGDPLLVPWEAIEFGEVGVRSPMIAVDHQSPEDRADAIRDGWLRMRLVANMDPNGLFYLRR